MEFSTYNRSDYLGGLHLERLEIDSLEPLETESTEGLKREVLNTE